MDRTTIALVIIAGVLVIGGIFVYTDDQNKVASQTNTVVLQPSSATPAAPVATTTASGTASLMQSTGKLFTDDPSYSMAHEVYPTPAADLQATLGAFSYATTELGGGAVQVSLENKSIGYQGAGVTVGPDQKVYFVERSARDDADGQDPGTRDDYLVAVDADGYTLQ